MNRINKIWLGVSSLALGLAISVGNLASATYDQTISDVASSTAITIKDNVFGAIADNVDKIALLTAFMLSIMIVLKLVKRMAK